MAVPYRIEHFDLGKSHPPMLWYDTGGFSAVGTLRNDLVIVAPHLKKGVLLEDPQEVMEYLDYCKKHRLFLGDRAGGLIMPRGWVDRIFIYDSQIHAGINGVNGVIPKGLANLCLGVIQTSQEKEALDFVRESNSRLNRP